MNTIGERIKIVRNKEKLTQKEFASHLLISQAYLSGLEKGTEKPSDKIVKLISLEFGINEQWLLTGEGDYESETFEYSREESTRFLNHALVKFLAATNNPSNEIYYYVTTILMSIADIMDRCINNEALSKEMLEAFGEFMVTLEDYSRFTIGDKHTNDMSSLKESCNRDLTALLSALDKNIK